MERTFSQDFKRFFLLSFTRELIMHSMKEEMINFESIINSRKEKKKDEEEVLTKPIVFFTENFKKPEIKENIIRVKNIIEPKPQEVKGETVGEPIHRVTMEMDEVKSLVQEATEKQAELANTPAVINPPPKQIAKPGVRYPLFIPEPKLPSHLEYLKPVASPSVDIDLFKLNPLIKDPAVRVIEVSQGERVIVSGTMGTKPTEIRLSKEEINQVINQFSEVSKIPVNEGIYRIIVGDLILSAIISETIDSKFIIKKMSGNQNPQMNKQPRYPAPPFARNHR